MYGINEKVYNNLITYFNKKSEIKRVILFGSRAKGNARKNSDIDLCIECEKNSEFEVIDTIDEIVGIYSIDIVFYDSLNLEIKNQIDRYGIDIYTKVYLNRDV